MWTQLIEGLGSGLVIALLGYAKSATEESWDWQKFGVTTLLGAIIGGIAGYMGIAYDTAAQMSIVAAITYAVDSGWKAIWKWATQEKSKKSK